MISDHILVIGASDKNGSVSVLVMDQELTATVVALHPGAVTY